MLRLLTFNGAALYVFIEGREYLPSFFQNYVIEWSLFLVAEIFLFQYSRPFDANHVSPTHSFFDTLLASYLL